MEVLSDILSGLRVSGSVYFCDFLRPPWRLPYENESRAMFHLVRRGRCQVHLDDESVELEAGDFVFFAPGTDHSVTSVDGSESDTLLLCGYCEFDALEGDVLVQGLPRFVLLRRDDFDDWPWLVRTLEHLSAEYMSEAPGSQLTVDKLTEVLLVQLFRANFGRRGEEGIVAALKDKRIARALQTVHDDPSRAWTLESAAAQANLSRSGFARIFKELIGTGFFEYLTRLRMQKAREQLRSGSLPVYLVAENVGYQSDLAFVKAFKKVHGKTPRQWRIENAESAR